MVGFDSDAPEDPTVRLAIFNIISVFEVISIGGNKDLPFYYSKPQTQDHQRRI